MKKLLSVLMAVIMVFSVIAVAFSAMVVVSPVSSAADADTSAEETGNWIAAWGSGMTNLSFADYGNIVIPVKGVVARTYITPTASGTKARIKFSNLYGVEPLIISWAAVGLKDEEGNFIDNLIGTDKKFLVKDTQILKMDGNSTLTIPPGEERYTDPVDLTVTDREEIAISMFIEDWVQVRTVGLSGGTTYLAPSQDKIDAFEPLFMDDGFYDFPISSNTVGRFTNLLNSLPEINVVPFISAVDVYNTEDDPCSVVVIGDSTVTNKFPDYLARLIYAEGNTSTGVICKGIIGNSLLSDGQGTFGRLYGKSVLNRLTTDVLDQSGVKYAVIKVGANDITHPVSASIEQYGNYEQPDSDDMIKGYVEFINTCHDYGIKVIACSITQWKGTTRNYFASNNETDEYTWSERDWQIAKEVNEWLASTDMLDGYVDLTTMTGSKNDPDMFSANYTSDYIHPNDSCQQAWASAFPLSLLGVKTVPKSISLNYTSKTVSVGEQVKLKATVRPSGASTTGLTWRSSNTSVATVNGDGLVTTYKNGTATISCTTPNGITAKCKITVATDPTGVTIDRSSATLYVTQTLTLKSEVVPSNAVDKSVTWSSSNPSVATVSAKGKVTAVSAGTATITCTTNAGNKKDTCKITVKKGVSVTGVTLNSTKKTLYKGGSYTLVPTITPSGATNKAVSWTSSNESVASVSGSGKVTALKNGKAVITCTTKDGKYTATCTVTVKTHVTGISLDKTSKTGYIGKSFMLTETVKPSSATNKAVTWKSSNSSVAKVDKDGIVTGVKAGTATITCTTVDGSYKATCKVTIKKYVKVKGVSLNKTSVTVTAGDSYTLKATVTPSTASNKSVSWKSSNTAVARVSSAGKITAVAPGSATITCTTKDGSYKATCKVKVKGVPVSSVSLNNTALSMQAGGTAKLTATVRPSNAANKSVSWKSSDTSVATVSSTGKVTAVSKGTCTITCTTKDGGKKAKCTVTVKGSSSSSSDSPSGSLVYVVLNKSTLNIRKGATYQLTATVKNSSNTSVKWSSSNPAVATVSSTGKVTGVKAGTAMIYCEAKDGGWISTCTVTVTN